MKVTIEYIMFKSYNVELALEPEHVGVDIIEGFPKEKRLSRINGTAFRAFSMIVFRGLCLAILV